MSTEYGRIAGDEQLTATAATLEANGFTTQVVEDGSAAKNAVLALIPKGSDVFTNTSATLQETGLTDILNGDDYVSVRGQMMALAGDPTKKAEMKRVTAAPSYAVGSVHAVTRDGMLLIASASGSQIPGEAYGADHVVFVVGAQKLVDDLADGIKRIENHVVPLEDARAQQAYGIHTSFNKLLVLRKEQPGRIHVVLVKTSLGF